MFFYYRRLVTVLVSSPVEDHTIRGDLSITASQQ